MQEIIIVDTREKGNKKILEYFDSVNQNYIISKLDAGDYMLFKNYNTIIDKTYCATADLNTLGNA